MEKVHKVNEFRYKLEDVYNENACTFFGADANIKR